MEQGIEEKDVPGILMNEKEKEIKLLEYSDVDFSMEEEKNYNKKEDATYFARMDTDVSYNDKNYYKKFYISKDVIVEKNKKGIYDSSGVYITPMELENMDRGSLITIEEIERGVFKEYEDGTTLIHWTTPVAELYYDKQGIKKKINEYTYNTLLKREFVFNPFNFFNSYIAQNKFYKDGTVDEFLIKILLDKKNSNDLTDIIYSIQENQNKIIRTNQNENFIVQGCAGSGKTMILLHRLSYLKFNNKLPNYDKIKIITPNKLFESFIGNLTKDLSIEEIEKMTITNYYLLLNNEYIKRYNKIEQIDNRFYRRQQEKFKREFIDSNIVLDDEIWKDKISNIYSSDALNMVEEWYNNIINEVNKAIIKNNLGIEEKYSSNQIYYEQVIKNIDLKISELNANGDVNTLKKDFQDEIEKINEVLQDLQKKVEKNSANIEQVKIEYKDLENKRDIELNKKKIFFKNMRNNSIFKKYEESIGEKISQLSILDKNKNSFIQNIKENTERKDYLNSQIEVYEKQTDEKDFIQVQIKKYNDIKDKILNSAYFTMDIYEKIKSKILKKYEIQDKGNQFSKIDLVFYLYINYLHIGKLINSDNLLCVDEAQNYNQIEFEVLRKVNPNMIMNLYGDVNQSINAEGIYDWSEMKNKFDFNMYELKENYRNSKEVSDYCNKKFKYNILGMGLSIKRVEKIADDKINNIIDEKVKENRSIAIIGKKSVGDKKIDNKLISYLTVSEAKGTEYNTVVVDEKGMSQNERYIAYTRALSELYIIKS